ncbi:hypothetical protein EVAR_79324_1 [Eumeta japonica]|uniref:Uncharacterized protein n=1 Tax=Eumeta variegata TaxID=151549 RepID=A0A4C1THR4_EUMVA|nr:hypothetical protein EVAR_79324_1 [Eumeta japonica]
MGSVLHPTLMYGSESWVWQKKNERSIKVVEMRSLRSMYYGVSRKGRCRDSDVGERCGLKEDVVTKVESWVSSFFGFMAIVYFNWRITRHPGTTTWVVLDFYRIKHPGGNFSGLWAKEPIKFAASGSSDTMYYSYARQLRAAKTVARCSNSIPSLYTCWFSRRTLRPEGGAPVCFGKITDTHFGSFSILPRYAGLRAGY